MSETTDIQLADVIDGLRAELEAAVRRGKGNDIRFGLGDITVELEVAVSRELEAGGGLKFPIVGEAKAGAKTGRSATQKVTVTLKPEGPKGEKIRTAARRD